MKSFLLLNSPIFWDKTAEKEQYLSPLGLAYIATYLDKAGVKVELLDCVKKEMSVEEIIKYINESRPDYLGMNVFTENYELVKHIIEEVNIP